MNTLRLKRNWALIVRKAWSVRFMVLAFVLTMLEVALPFFDDSIPKHTFAILSGLAVAGAFVARLVAQRDVNDD